jgi:hypothetical protein
MKFVYKGRMRFTFYFKGVRFFLKLAFIEIEDLESLILELLPLGGFYRAFLILLV